jgi:hypothetical protein
MHVSESTSSKYCRLSTFSALETLPFYSQNTGTMPENYESFNGVLLQEIVSMKTTGHIVRPTEKILLQYFGLARQKNKCFAGNLSSAVSVFPSHKIIISPLYFIEKTVANPV